MKRALLPDNQLKNYILRKEFHIEIDVSMLQNFGCRMQFVRVEEPVLVRNVHCIVKILNDIQ